jgi:hypothetical protein
VCVLKKTKFCRRYVENIFRYSSWILAPFWIFEKSLFLLKFTNIKIKRTQKSVLKIRNSVDAISKIEEKARKKSVLKKMHICGLQTKKICGGHLEFRRYFIFWSLLKVFYPTGWHLLSYYVDRLHQRNRYWKF